MGRIYLNDDWLFTEKFDESMCDKECTLVEGQVVRLPHTCKELPFNYFDENEYQMICGYRRILSVPVAWKGKTVLFTCEGAGHETTLYVNGQTVYKHSCGYTGFTVDISRYLTYGEDNYLVMKVDSRETLNVPPFGFVIDYMTFGGVYREVYLEVKEQAYIRDVFVKASPADKALGKGDLCCDISFSEGILPKEAGVENHWYVQGCLRRRFTDVCPQADGDNWNEKAQVFDTCEVAKGALQISLARIVERIHIWDTQTPYLYELEIQLTDGNQIIDTYEVTFGFRSVEFRTDGFYLNGEKFKIRGLNRHQSYPYVGYAMPESMQRYDADILKKELGCNAIRTSHYPQSHHFIDRCDELGLLVFMEIPGWQHIGDGEWKMQACQNVRDMILQYRNHPSIMIWGVRINESQDDDRFYEETNRIAHELDETRATGGVRNFRKSHLLEDVYTYNDFVHDGKKTGCEPKKNITSDINKAYLITEYNGHMYPTKPFDWEEHRLEHAMRHARVIDAVGKEEDIAGSFGWCMFDYNTHKDFGSGDRICYHGVTDMFRNSKLAAMVYASQQEEEIVLELSSSMDIGEHPATNLGRVYLFTNADSVRMYKNGIFIKEYKPQQSEFQGIPHGPILIDDFVGDMLETKEGYAPKQARMLAAAMNYIAVHGYQSFPPHIIWTMLKAVIAYRMNPLDLVHLYTKYIGNWGETATVYRFEAIKNGEVVKTLIKQPMKRIHPYISVSHHDLQEKHGYDVAAIRIRAVDDNDNPAPYYQEAIRLIAEGPIEIIGPDTIALKGGMGGFYVKSTGTAGTASVTLQNPQFGTEKITFTITTTL